MYFTVLAIGFMFLNTAHYSTWSHDRSWWSEFTMVPMYFWVPLPDLAIQASTQSCPTIRYRQKISMHSCNESCSVQFRWHDCRQLSLPTKYAWRFHHCFKLLVPRKCTDVIYTPRQKKLFLYILTMKFQTVKLQNTQTL